MLIKIYILSIILCLASGELVILRFKSIIGNEYKKKKQTMLQKCITCIRNIGFSMIPGMNILASIMFAIMFLFASDEWLKKVFKEGK